MTLRFEKEKKKSMRDLDLGIIKYGIQKVLFVLSRA